MQVTISYVDLGTPFSMRTELLRRRGFKHDCLSCDVTNVIRLDTGSLGGSRRNRTPGCRAFVAEFRLILIDATCPLIDDCDYSVCTCVGDVVFSHTLTSEEMRDVRHALHNELRGVRLERHSDEQSELLRGQTHA
jgi:hypothetical protein